MKDVCLPHKMMDMTIVSPLARCPSLVSMLVDRLTSIGSPQTLNAGKETRTEVSKREQFESLYYDLPWIRFGCKNAMTKLIETNRL